MNMGMEKPLSQVTAHSFSSVSLFYFATVCKLTMSPCCMVLFKYKAVFPQDVKMNFHNNDLNAEKIPHAVIGSRHYQQL
jgi:hypothetical protein